MSRLNVRRDADEVLVDEMVKFRPAPCGARPHVIDLGAGQRRRYFSQRRDKTTVLEAALQRRNRQEIHGIPTTKAQRK